MRTAIASLQAHVQHHYVNALTYCIELTKYFNPIMLLTSNQNINQSLYLNDRIG